MKIPEEEAEIMKKLVVKKEPAKDKESKEQKPEEEKVLEKKKKPMKGKIPSSKTLTVSGRISHPKGKPRKNLTIKAFDKDLGREIILGEATTDESGKYTITYKSDQLSRASKTNADLIIRAYDKKGDQVAVSPLILNTSDEQVVELGTGNKLFGGSSEYEKIRKVMEPVLDNKNAADLNVNDIKYLSGKTGIDPVRINYLVQSEKLEQETDISSEMFYGLFRQNLPTSLPALIACEPSVIRRALEKAIQENIIGEDAEAQIDTSIEKLQAQIIEHAFKEPEIPNTSSLSELLELANLSTEQQRAFLDSYLKHEGPIQEFWQGMRGDERFGEDTVNELQFTLQLGILTQNHLPLIKILKQQQAGKEEPLRDLAKMTQDDWIALIEKEIDGETVSVPPTIQGKNETEKEANYALILMRMLEDAFPTDFIAHRIKDGDFEHASEVSKFFTNNPDFDFRAMKIHTYLKEKDNALEGIENREAVKKKLMGIQRLYNISPRFDKYDVISVLLEDNIDSANAIRLLGKHVFIKRYAKKLGEKRAWNIYDKAEQVKPPD